MRGPSWRREWRSLSGPLSGWGEPIPCDNGNGVAEYWAFVITLDPDTHWWTTRDDIPDASPPFLDLWSVTSHEIGHVSGMLDHDNGHGGHFSNADSHYCQQYGDADYLSRETMCASTLWNSRVGRNHDDHSTSLFGRAYRWPPPPPPPGGGGGGGGGPPYLGVCELLKGGVAMGAPGSEIAASYDAIEDC